MKRFLLLALATFLISGTWGVVAQTSAQSGPIISDIYESLTVNTLYVSWKTDVTTTAKIEYGKSSGQLSNEVNSTSTGSATSHQAYLRDLDFETTYYYQIVVTDLQGNTTRSDERSFTTSSKNLRFDAVKVKSVGSDKAVVMKLTNKASWSTVKYGSAPDALTQNAHKLELEAGGGGSAQQHFVLINLKPNTTYYYQVTAERSENWYGVQEGPITSDVKSVTTTGPAEITSISPTQGPPGGRLTIHGRNFGAESDTNFLRRIVTIGGVKADILEWTDTAIVVHVPDPGTSGPVTVEKTVAVMVGVAEANIFTIKDGPRFTVAGASVSPDADGGSPTDGGSPIVTSAFGCTLSTNTRNAHTLKVPTIPVQGDSTYTYLQGVYDAYNDAWNREPRCDELQFHLDHRTPLDRLQSWLAGEAITEKFGCAISTEHGGEKTIQVKEALRAGTTTDEYLDAVYAAYQEHWSREPRCDELQFHLDHRTPLDRLTAWLAANAPEEETPAGDTTATLTFTDSNGTITASPRSYTDTDVITFSGTTTPNSIVSLVIASGDPILATVLADSDGNWSYTLPGPLEAGDHTVKVAVSDSAGTVLSESGEIAFTVSAAAATDTTTEGASSGSADDNTGLFLWLISIVIGFIVVFVIVVMVRHSRSSS